ncbi:MAG: hypothetical protein IJK26_10555 [Clostridia bacterium]|nr:hypothetical protein [Clostridia bacterium]
MRKDEYIASAVSKITNKKAKRETEKELAAHIDELIDRYVNSGYTAPEAEEKAVAEMGDSEKVSQEMGKLYKGTGCLSRIVKFLLKVCLMILILVVIYKAYILLSPIDCFNNSDVKIYTPSGINGRYHLEWLWTDIEEYWVFKLTRSQSEELNKDLSENYWVKLDSSPLSQFGWNSYDNVFKKQTDLTENCYICVYDVYSKEFITDRTENIIDTTTNWVIVIYDKANEYYYCIHQSL